ncbi:MAG: hypothetical protein Q8N00_02065 [Nitrospirota bacterium]|nr:hypothetical protein [Nitrospirota bacterium]
MQLITSEVKLSRQEILRLSKRCLTLHSDGNIWGFRALLQHQHQKPYIRTQEVRKSRHQHKGGAAGALMRLFDCHPSIRETVDQLFLKQGPKEVVQESRIQVKAIHKRFIAACKAKGLTAGDYPLNMNHRGRRALGSYLRRLLKQNLQEAAKARYGKDAARRLSLDGGGDANMVRRPYERTQFDGHRIDAFFTIELPHPSGGTQILTLDRLWILLIKDVFSRAVLGYVICISKEYSQVDVLRCVKRAVLPWTRMDLTISGLHYPEGGGFPSAVLPDYVWAVWDEFWMDNGKANLAEAVRTTLTRTIGCAVNAGPVNAPERRSIIERFFQTLEENGYHRLPSTTGSGPKDPRRNDPEKAALRYHIKFEHLEQLTDVMIAQYNGAPHSSLGCSPLERLAYCVNDSSLLPRTLSEHLRSNLALLGVPALRTIQGSLKHGKCAYVEFEGVRYSNDVLRRSPDLIGQKLSLRIDLEDLRCITAFLASGQEFGVLTAHGLWGRTPHSLEARKAINHLRIRKLIHYTDQDDPMHVYMDYLSHNAATSKEARSRYVKVKTALETTPPPTLMLTLPSATPREEESSDSDSPVTRTTFLY